MRHNACNERGMTRAHSIALLAGLTLACHSSKGPAASTGELRVELTLNGGRLGSHSCDLGLFFATRITNASTQPLQVHRLAVRFVSNSAACTSQVAAIDSQVSIGLEPGAVAAVRRFDAAGQLCQAPRGGPECAWTAIAEATSALGTTRDELGFATYLPGEDRGCAGVTPRLVAPADGAVLSGTVDVVATVAESASCVNSARTIIEGFSERGVPAFRSSSLDLGEPFRWNTRDVANGRYWITAYQNCCRVRGAPVVVTVRN